MKFATYIKSPGGEISYGLINDELVVDLPLALKKMAAGTASSIELLPPVDLEGFVSQGEDVLIMAKAIEGFIANSPDGIQDYTYPVAQVKLCSPLRKPGKIICIGLNYAEHAKEGGRDIPAEPVLFGKYANALVGPGEAVRLPHISDKVDYEAELAVVIGKKAHRVEKEEALDYVFGYANFNDISARDLQKKDGQWMKGKFLDTFAPFGPYLVTQDEIPDSGKLDICLRLNGDVMQSSNTGDMIFNVPYLVAFLSQFVTLEPGDIIATGTPPGVGFARKPPIFLKAGDVVEVEVSGLGVLKNPVIQG